MKVTKYGRMYKYCAPNYLGQLEKTALLQDKNKFLVLSKTKFMQMDNFLYSTLKKTTIQSSEFYMAKLLGTLAFYNLSGPDVKRLLQLA